VESSARRGIQLAGAGSAVTPTSSAKWADPILRVV
jgi:hypothetical protein